MIGDEDSCIDEMKDVIWLMVKVLSWWGSLEMELILV